MSGVLAYVQNQIPEFSLEEQLYLLAYIANNVNKKNKANHTSAKKKSYFGALKNKISYIAPDFDDPLSDFAEYM